MNRNEFIDAYTLQQVAQLPIPEPINADDIDYITQRIKHFRCTANIMYDVIEEKRDE